MKKYLLCIGLTAAIIIAVIVASYQFCNTKRYNLRQVSPLLLTLQLDQSKYHVGQPIIATITLENTSTSPHLVNSRMALNDPVLASPIRELAFHITQPKGNAYQIDGFINYPAIQIDDFVTINPNEVIKRTYELNTEYSRYQFTDLGTYTIIIDYLNIVDPGFIDSNDSREAWKGMLFSNEVQFTIIP